MARRDERDLERFVDAQEGIGMHTSTYATALAEIRAGRKVSHWIWYVFPQLKGLGHSDYPVLGARLRECCEALLAQKSRDALAIFGSMDYPKVRSCMTLFAAVSHDPLFLQVLDEFYDGSQDRRTLDMISH